MKIILVGNHWEPKWREYVKIVQLLNIEFYIRLILKLLGSQCQREIHNPFMVVFVRISDSRSTSTMSSRRLPEMQLNLCDSMAANADIPKYNGACTNLPEHVSEAVQVHS